MYIVTHTVKGIVMSTFRAAAFSAALLAVLAAPVSAQDKPATSSVPLLKTTTTGDGVPLVYPTGTPEITARITTFPPGAETVMHRHPQPLFGYLLEGELTIYPEGQEPRRFKAGDAFMETAAWHVGRNEGSVPARLLAVYSGAQGLPLSEAHK